MKLFRIALLVSTLLIFVGCASQVPLQRGQIGALTRNAAPEAVEQILNKATPNAQFQFSSGGNTFAVRHFRLQTGTQQQMTMVCTPTCMPIFYTVPVTTPYLVIQTLPSRALHAWGTIEELSKDPDTNISSIMPELKVHLEVALKAPK
jgi:hypothetical protein